MPDDLTEAEKAERFDRIKALYPPPGEDWPSAADFMEQVYEICKGDA